MRESSISRTAAAVAFFFLSLSSIRCFFASISSSSWRNLDSRCSCKCQCHELNRGPVAKSDARRSWPKHRFGELVQRGTWAAEHVPSLSSREHVFGSAMSSHNATDSIKSANTGYQHAHRFRMRFLLIRLAESLACTNRKTVNLSREPTMYWMVLSFRGKLHWRTT